MNAVTVINNQTNEVQFANQDRIGPSFVYLKFFKSNRVGELVEGSVKRIHLGNVTILEHHRFDLLSAYTSYQQDMMIWNLKHQEAEHGVRINLVAEISNKVDKVMVKWAEVNPKPGIPEIISGTLYPDGETGETPATV